MMGENNIVVTSVGRLLSGREAERGFWDPLHVQNRDLGSTCKNSSS